MNKRTERKTSSSPLGSWMEWINIYERCRDSEGYCIPFAMSGWCSLGMKETESMMKIRIIAAELSWSSEIMSILLLFIIQFFWFVCLEHWIKSLCPSIFYSFVIFNSSFLCYSEFSTESMTIHVQPEENSLSFVLKISLHLLHSSSSWIQSSVLFFPSPSSSSQFTFSIH